MSTWRVIITDSESTSGVAPICSNQRVETDFQTHPQNLLRWTRHETYMVYDCCPQPHIECYSEKQAQTIAHLLSLFGATLCQ